MGRRNNVFPMPRKASVATTRCCASSSSGLRPDTSDTRRFSRMWACSPINTFSRTVNCGSSCTDWNVLRGTSDPDRDRPDEIQRLGDLLHDLRSTPDFTVRVKVPEGFAFYTLYPEQYCAAASRWCDEHATSARRVLVVGVRSIGTSLSALVADASILPML